METRCVDDLHKRSRFDGHGHIVEYAMDEVTGCRRCPDLAEDVRGIDVGLLDLNNPRDRLVRSDDESIDVAGPSSTGLDGTGKERHLMRTTTRVVKH